MARILVVDDDRVIRRLAHDLLTDEGFEVTSAENGSAGLEALLSERPGLVLLDLRMPSMDGRTFHASMPADCRDIPILVLSGSSDIHEVAAEIGAAGALQKPFDLDELVQAVRRILPSS